MIDENYHIEDIDDSRPTRRPMTRKGQRELVKRENHLSTM